MKPFPHVNKKQVLVLGLAKSGMAAAVALHKLGAIVTVNDGKPRAESKEVDALEEKGIEVVCGGHPLHLLDTTSLIIKNPGIPYSNLLITEAMNRNIPIWTEVELAYRIAEAEIVAITGSNGKTTTTTLVHAMLEHSERTPLIAGNIGTVATSVALEATKENVMVLELSSFQLMGTEQFKPKVAVWLNLFDAHLDYHGSKELYIEAKAKVYENMTKEDYLVYSADDLIVAKHVQQSKATLVPFSTKLELPTGAYIKDNAIYFREERICPLDEIVLPGAHNIENMLASVAAAKLAGGTNAQIKTVLTTFTGVKHRLQFVGDVHGRKVYNDSKATNILATQAALASFKQDIVLLAGGLDRGNEFDELSPSLTHVKTLVVFGETKTKLTALGNKLGINVVQAIDVRDAATKAFEHSNVKDVVLLSPACASWDQYSTFEERGDAFLATVSQLSNSQLME
ncbi:MULTISPECIES: UDP-N-acetylmuramoyl-L-alanine--D-glutamate ligase [Bacillaceae]|uniref:UDP-N-acetylmuramoylalanine--D-glutamate ligase n=1 Tax=Alkalicoccobacillus plakortidis TaxID=444060 RepID=A0A9D5DSX2_9BACI|nr:MULTISPECIES: UDP-N-acetylmuramoyl-L-alanine--D-glutamate ligase [Bacillaceae]KQL58155.1 UDP-N-acetylmuramoylalanine--D-glutamate ligase [Alkalicoccobacillus plakortidis]